MIFTSIDTVQSFMREIGPTMSDIETVIQHDPTSWELIFSDTSCILVEWVDGPPRLTFTTTIGHPNNDRRLDVYETLLSYNALKHETGSIRTALGGPHGQAILICELHSENFSEHEFCASVENFMSLGHMWIEYVTSSNEVDAAPPSLMDMMQSV
jgi:hypothetical protein